MDLAEKSRARRKGLVVAAEKVAAGMFRDNRKPDTTKSQLNHLISVCGEATCTEEIENYLRYQGARNSKGTGWTPDLAQDVIAGIAGSLAGVEDDGERVGAWRQYAIFLARAFTFHEAVYKARNPRDGERSRERRQ